MKQKFSDLRQKFKKSESISNNLIEAFDSKDSLKERVKENALSLEKYRVLLELEKLPIDKLRDASSTSIKIEYLKRSGFENMRQVYEAPATLNFNFFEHGSDVIKEESPYKPDPVLLRGITIHLDL